MNLGNTHAMDSLIFYIEADKAYVNMLESIKAFFGNRHVQISVQPEADPLTLDDLEEKVNQNRASPVAYVLQENEFDEVARKLLNDDPIDREAYKR